MASVYARETRALAKCCGAGSNATLLPRQRDVSGTRSCFTWNIRCRPRVSPGTSEQWRTLELIRENGLVFHVEHQAPRGSPHQGSGRSACSAGWWSSSPPTGWCGRCGRCEWEERTLLRNPDSSGIPLRTRRLLDHCNEAAATPHHHLRSPETELPQSFGHPPIGRGHLLPVFLRHDIGATARLSGQLRHQQQPTNTQKWGCTLGGHSRWTERSRHDGVGVTSVCRLSSGLLRTGAHNFDIREIQRHDSQAEPLGPARGTIEQHHSRLGLQRSEHQSRHAGSGSEIDDPVWCCAAVADIVQCFGEGKRVLDVVLDRCWPE